LTAILAPETTSEERTMALISHALSFIEGGVFAPLLMYVFRTQVGELLYKGTDLEHSEFIAFHSLQSTYFGLLFLAVSVPLALLTCGFSLFLTVPIYLIYEVIACIKSNSGEWYRLPFVGDLAAQKHPPPGV
jgi:uncharacterized membrane protein